MEIFNFGKEDEKPKPKIIYPIEVISGLQEYCTNNRALIKRLEQEIGIGCDCGCFYCCSIFKSWKIKEWVLTCVTEMANDAVCPNCGIDSILPELMVYGDKEIILTIDLLEQMHDEWFQEGIKK
jgi:hypothetical protein